VIFITLKAPSPLHAYASSIGLFVFYHAWHLIIGLVVMTLVLVRTMRGRITNREYMIEIVGRWLWWAAAAAVAVLVLTTAIA
jgi:cytochrome b561